MPWWAVLLLGIPVGFFMVLWLASWWLERRYSQPDEGAEILEFPSRPPNGRAA